MSSRLPVALLHGWGGSAASTWEGWPAALREVGRNVVEVELPGHGRDASADPGAYTDLAGLLDAALPEGRLDAVCFSLGGKLALALAARSPERFGRLVVGGVGDNLFAAEPSGEAVAAALLDGVAPDTPAAVVAIVSYAEAGGGDPLALAALLRRPANPVLSEADLGRVDGVLLVNGDRDAVALPDERLRAALPGARAVRLGGVDHLALTRSPVFRDLAIEHLNMDPVGREETR